MRRWISEPLLAGAILIGLYLVWILLYLWQSASTGVLPNATAWDFVIRVVSGIAVFVVPIALWVGLAIAGGYLARGRGFGIRLLVAWLAGVVLCLPFVIFALVSLSMSDGWGGLGVISLLIPVAAPFAVVPAYCAAAVLQHYRGRDRREGFAQMVHD